MSFRQLGNNLVDHHNHPTSRSHPTVEPKFLALTLRNLRPFPPLNSCILRDDQKAYGGRISGPERDDDFNTSE